MLVTLVDLTILAQSILKKHPAARQDMRTQLSNGRCSLSDAFIFKFIEFKNQLQGPLTRLVIFIFPFATHLVAIDYIPLVFIQSFIQQKQVFDASLYFTLRFVKKTQHVARSRRYSY